MSITQSGTSITFNDSTTQSSAALPGVLAQLFTSSGTFTVPSGVTAVKVTCIGGGGGTGINSSGAGGTSSFSTYLTASGGNPGNNTGFGNGGTPGGTANNGPSLNGGVGAAFNYGGNSICGGGAPGGNAYTTNYGSCPPIYITYPGYGPTGGGGLNSAPLSTAWGCGSGLYGGGGGSAMAIGYVTGLTPGGTVTVTIGSGGNAGNYGSAGIRGYVLVEW